jgi:hypothetical protein
MKLKTEIDFQFFFEENENSYSDLVTHQIGVIDIARRNREHNYN